MSIQLIQLNEWYYHSSMCGYQTRSLVINVEEISDFHETQDVDRGYRAAVQISLKNGKTYNVKETYKDVLEKIYFGREDSVKS